MSVAMSVCCASCGARLAHDHVDTICSPCRRTMIEAAANRQTRLSRDLGGIKAAFESGGLYEVAEHLGVSPSEALDVIIEMRLLPFVSERRRALLHQLVSLRNSSHVAVAEALHISRWTVATYRHQLGIDRVPASLTGGRR